MTELPKCPLEPSAWADVYKQAQQDMIAAGYRQVPSVEEIAVKLCRLVEADQLYHVRPLADNLHHWLLEDDKE